MSFGPWKVYSRRGRLISSAKTKKEAEQLAIECGWRCKIIKCPTRHIRYLVLDKSGHLATTTVFRYLRTAKEYGGKECRIFRGWFE